jgi:hypothetical protein
MSEPAKIPVFNSALSGDERRAVEAHVAGTLAAEMRRQLDGPGQADLVANLVMTLVVKASWAADRCAALEQKVADLEMALARKTSSPAAKRLDQLSQRVAELEAGGLIYCGVWAADGSAYRKGTLVTHAGSAWIALREVKPGEQPGTCDAWQLAVKRGKDGRDLRP